MSGDCLFTKMKTIPKINKKKNATSSESSTNSSSDSSTSSSSSSDSDSSSSSDSESSSSQESTNNKKSDVDASKKPTQIPKNPRKSIETKQVKLLENKTVNKAKSVVKPTKTVQKPHIYSSDDDDNEKGDVLKRKSKVKPKSSATITPKVAPTTTPKAVSKSNGKNAGKTQQIKGKEAVKRKQKVVAKNSGSDVKKKSIFSPENSSESESAKTKGKSVVPKSKPEPRVKAGAKTLENSNGNNNNSSSSNSNVNKGKVEKKVAVKSKEIIESSASSTSSSTGSTSSSDSDSSAESSTNKKNIKKPVKKPTVISKEPDVVNTDSDNETAAMKKKVTRKLTRSASARKSKHVLGKSVYSDSDSDSESTVSRSPVKKSCLTKGKAKNNKKVDSKLKREVLIEEERKCPMENCNSTGHLSGKFDRHFTLEACPFYHNLNIEKCKNELEERKKREEIRKKTIELNKINDQKLYLQKIRDMRTKFKAEPDVDVKPCTDKNREPDLTNFVSEYDLKLFRDAQALASEKIEEDLKNLPNTKGTKYIEMGKFEMEVWYQSPYPEDYARLPKLYICEYCLRYMKSRTILDRHVVKCVWRHPPGEEVYRKDKISVWEVDGKRYKQYCQNLCLLAKFFLDHKTLYSEVEPFLFYVMTMVDSDGCHTVGYFSKEKNSLSYNVSCILTLPPYQRQGYGRLLIDFSYLLSKVEGKIGSPEKPLSDLGLISYRSYWKDVLLGYLCSRPGTQLSVKDISQEMAIHSYDIVSTLQALGMMKYWKGKHIILKKQDVLDEYVERVKKRGPELKVDQSCLRWNPSQPASVSILK